MKLNTMLYQDSLFGMALLSIPGKITFMKMMLSVEKIKKMIEINIAENKN